MSEMMVKSSSEAKDVDMTNTEIDNKAAKLSLKKLKGGRKVRVNYTIFRVSNIDTASQTFFCDFKLYFRWKDESLIGKEVGELNTDEIWTPQWYITNAAELEESKHRVRLKDSKTGTVHEQVRFKGTLSEFFELQKFPFDYQELHIDIASHLHMGKVEFIHNDPKERVNTMDEFYLQSWFCIKHDCNVNKLYLDDLNAAYSHYVPYVVVKRSSWYYFNNVILLMFLLVLFNYSCTAIEPDDFGTRSGITLTILLTAVALKFAVSDSLPKVAFMTILDVYLLAAFVFLFALGILNYIIARLMRSNTYDHGKLKDWDDALSNLWLAAWLGFQLIYVLYCTSTTNRCKYDNEKEIDEVAEVLELIDMYSQDSK